MRHIGIYPGSFDPVHKGHLAFAAEARRTLHLDSVAFLPEPRPRDKPLISPWQQRVTGLRQEFFNHEAFIVVEAKSHQFTVQHTLFELRQLFGEETRLTLLIGSDVLRSLHAWEDVAELLSQISLAVGLRGDDTSENVEKMLLFIEDQIKSKPHYTILTTSYPHESSTLARTGNKNKPSGP